MSKKTTTFVFREEYENWLSKNNINSFGAYCPQDKFNIDGKDYLFLDLIGIFAYLGEYFYVSALFEEWKAEINKKNDTKTILNRYYYLDKYRQFIESRVYGKKRVSNLDKGRIQNFLQDLPSVRDAINKSQNPKVDGMDSLIRYIDEKQFVKLAIESSYFFSRELVEERFKEIKNYIRKQSDTDPAFKNYGCKYLPARFTQKDDKDEDGRQIPDEEVEKVYFYPNSNGEPLCVIYQEGARGKNKKCGEQTCGGGNGNARVCQLIKSRTGYDLGATADKKHFRNFIISHIWGHAIDPRYFTNLWNIVLVPAWANHLLDKEEEGTLASTFKATIKNVIIKYYELDEQDMYNWQSIKMECPEYEREEVLNMGKGFQINIIKGLFGNKGSNKLFGDIKKETVNIQNK